MRKRFFALLLSMLIIFTEIAGSPMIVNATELSDETSQNDETELVDEGNEETEEEIVYYFPFWDTIDRLPSWTLDIGKTVGWQNRTTGEAGEIEITGISQSNEAVVSIEEWEDGTGWTLCANYELGASEIYLAYNDKDGNPAVRTFTMNVCNDVHSAAISNNSNAIGCAAPGESLSLYAEYDWQKYWVDESGQGWFGSGDTSNAVYTWSLDCSADVATIEAIGNTATVSFIDNPTNLGQFVTATVEISIDGNVVTSAVYNIEITGNYYYLQPIYLENADLEVGEVCEVTPELWQVEYSYNEEAGVGSINTIRVEEGVRYAWNWDMEAVRITDSEEKVLDSENFWSEAPSYTLEKLKNYQTDVYLDGGVWNEEEQDYIPVASRGWTLNELWYDVYFNDFQNYAFIGEDGGQELTLSLNTDSLQDKEYYDIEWRIGLWDEEDNCTPIENGITFNGDTAVTLDTKAIWDELVAQMDGEPEDTWFHVCVRVLLENGEEAYRLDEDINLRKEIVDARLHDLGDREILPCWTVDIGNTYECWVKNEDYPDGENLYPSILSVEVTNAADDEGEGDVVRVEQHEGGWTIYPNRTGHAVISYNYETYDGGSANGEFNIWVTNELYEMDFHSVNGTDCVLPGETYDLSIDLRRECYNPETNEYYQGDLTGYTYSWSIDDNSFGEDVSIEYNENTASISVRNNADLLGREIPVVIQVFAPEGGDPVTERRTSIWITDRYLEVQPAELNNQVDVYTTFTFAPSAVWHVYNPETGDISTEPVEGVRYRFEWDTNAFQITDANGKVLDGDLWENQTGDAPFTLKKLENCETEIQLLVEAPNDNGDYEEINRRNYWFGSIDYHADFRALNAGDHIRLWADNAEGQDVDVVLNMDNYAGKNVEIEWNFGFCDEEGNFEAVLNDAEGIYSLNEDNSVATLHSNALLAAIHAVDTNRNDCNLEVIIKVNGVEVNRFGTGIEVREEYVEYQFDIEDDVVLLPERGKDFNYYVNIHIENAEYPDGYDTSTNIENFIVENASDDEGAVVTVEQWEDGEGWYIHANRFGHAIGTITYTDVNGDTATKEINIWVADEVPYLEMYGDTNQIVPGETIIIDGNFGIEAYNEEQGHYQKDCTGYTFKWELADENWKEYVTLNEVTTEDANVARLEFSVAGDETAANTVMWSNIPVCLIVYAPESEGGHEVIRQDYWVNVVDSYYLLQPSGLDTYDLAIGETIEYDPIVEYHKYGEGTIEISDGFRYRWDWDTDAVKITDSDGNELTGENPYGTAPFTIERLTTWGTDVNCCVELYNSEEDCYYEVAGRNWHLNDLDYSFHFENLRGDGYTWLYINDGDGEAYEVSIQPHQDSVLDNCDIEWLVGYYDESGELSNLEAGEQTYEISEDGTSIIIHSNGIANALMSMKELENADYEEFTVRAVWKVKGTDTQMCSSEFNLQLRPEVYTYFETDGITNMPMWQITIAKDRKAYVENSENPYGVEKDFVITNVSVENADDGEGEVLSLEEWEDGNGWTVTSQRIGDANVIITYNDLNGVSQTHTFSVYVTGDYYGINMWSDTGTDKMLPGDSVTLSAELFHFVYDDESGEIQNGTVGDELTYEWFVDDWAVTIESDEATALISASKEYSDYEVPVTVVISENGEVRASATWTMYVCNGYYQLFADDKAYAQPGEAIELSAELKFISLENPEGIVVENVTYGVYDDYENIIASETGTGITISADAEVPENGYLEEWVNVTADAVNENGDEIHEEYGTTIIICNHNYEVLNTYDATCTEVGYIVYRCSICEHDVTEEQPALGHITVTDKAVAATCTKAGKTEGSHCSRCNTVFKAQTTVNALGHNSVTDKAVAATCTKAGKTEGSHCSRCNTILKAQTTVNALGHAVVTDKAVAATCTTAGKTEGSHCSRCNTVLKAQATVKALGHSSETIVTKATASKDGSIVKKCKVCGTVESTTAISKIASVTLDTTEYNYNGKVQQPAVTVKDSKGNALVKDKDYTVAYGSGCKNPGKYEVTVTFIGNYSGTEKRSFTIAPKATEITKLTPDKKTFTVKWTATPGSGYEIAYSTTEKFTKSKTKTTVVKGKNSKSKKITGLKATEKYYVRIRSYVTITVDGKETKLYSDWSEVMTVITETAKGKISAIKSVKLSETEYKYDGKAKKPTVTIKDKAGNTLEEGTDYKVTYASGRKKPGSYKVTVKYLGNYKSLKNETLYFTIAPKGVSVKKVTANSKGFKVTYGKGSNITGYEIQYSTSSKFTKKTTETVTVSKASTTSKTVKKLKGNKKYYVRVRTYKTVKVNGKSVKIYSDWSKAKSVKTKK